VQHALDVCSNVSSDRIRHTCYTRVGDLADSSVPRSGVRLERDTRVAVLFATAVAGEQREHLECEPTGFRRNHLDCRADYGEGSDEPVRVYIEEWVGKEQPPPERREQMTQTPQYIDSERAHVTSERRRDGTIRMYRGPEVIAADWISGNRYVKVLFNQPTKKEQAFIDHFLRAFPSTLQ